MLRIPLFAIILFAVAATAYADPIPAVQSASNMEIIGHSDLNGAGKGGEGLALRQYPDGRRVLFLAHESAPMCVSILDVTKPGDPRVIMQIPVSAPQLRCNSLGLSGTTLTVAQQTDKSGQSGAGMDVYDVADPARPRKLAYFDTSGPHSRGVHYVWFADGHYAYLTTGARDFIPNNPLDDQFFMVVDMSDPSHPHEAGRWWMPGTRVGDKEPAPPRVSIDSGIREHTPIVSADRPDRAYVGWIDGGFFILNISDKAHPKMVAHRSWQSQNVGFAHTVLPIPSRGLAIQTEEAVLANCKDWPKRDWVWDISNETAPVALSVIAPPADFAALCKQGGRFGAHNIHQNRPDPTARKLSKTVVGSFFNGGVRAYSIADPHDPKEIGFLIDAPPAGNATHSIQINDVYVDENGLIYANDRLSGGLDIIRYTGSVPLE
ncbi:LVIVD repeat-containing protein [Rhodopila sp.]|uniref:LVIVD repeat-containing protein n=1 Tax=Rhodopila sp. TaxID=2480087 RepID=UPI003D0DAE0F